MSKTIKQLAEELGVSKQAIQKRLTREPLRSSVAPYISTVGGTKYIEVVGENLIKSAFQRASLDAAPIDTGIDKTAAPIDTGIDKTAASIDTGIDKTAASIDTGIDKTAASTPLSIGETGEFASIIAVLQDTINALQKQMDTKDEQISSQQDLLAAKDEQIGQLTAALQQQTSALESTTAALTAAQALHAADKRSLMLLEDKENERKLSFWERRAAKKAAKKARKEQAAE